MTKKFWWGVFWTVLAVMATNFIIHSVFMKGTYAATAGLWRNESEMAANWPVWFVGQALFGFFIFWIYSIGYKGKGWSEAWRFALIFGCLQAGNTFMMYSVAPYTWGLVWSWVLWGFVQMWVIGLVATWAIKTWKIQSWNLAK